MYRFFWSWLISCVLLLLPVPSEAQYKLDVKTQAEEKRGLATIKHGVLQHVQKHPQFSEMEVGEDHSLWLTNEQRHISEDSMVVRIDVYLRTPAMLTSGEPIDRQRVSLKYDREKAQRYVRDSLQAWNAKEPSYQSLEQLAQVGGAAAGFAADFGMGTYGMSASTLNSLFDHIADELTVDPTPIELLESWKLGEKTVLATERMIEQNRSQ
jgi:hypothetical protein